MQRNYSSKLDHQVYKVILMLLILFTAPFSSLSVLYAGDLDTKFNRDDKINDKVVTKTTEIKNITVEELMALVANVDTTTKANIYDANNEATRAKAGVIKGAKRLTSFREYNPGVELPAAKDALLVFYCYNKLCTASHVAAKIAVDAEYENVRVLEEGVMGWKEKGGAVE